VPSGDKMTSLTHITLGIPTRARISPFRYRQKLCTEVEFASEDLSNALIDMSLRLLVQELQPLKVPIYANVKNHFIFSTAHISGTSERI